MGRRFSGTFSKHLGRGLGFTDFPRQSDLADTRRFAKRPEFADRVQTFLIRRGPRNGAWAARRFPEFRPSVRLG